MFSLGKRNIRRLISLEHSLELVFFFLLFFKKFAKNRNDEFNFIFVLALKRRVGSFGATSILSCFLLNQTSKQPCVYDCDDTQSKLGGAISGSWWVPNLWGMKCRELT